MTTKPLAEAMQQISEAKQRLQLDIAQYVSEAKTKFESDTGLIVKSIAINLHEYSAHSPTAWNDVSGTLIGAVEVKTSIED